MLRLRYASGVDDARAIWAMLVRMSDECAARPVNPGKAFTNICRCVDGGMVLLVEEAEAEDGPWRAVGSIGLEEAEYVYADASFFYDLWFYVVPEHRGGEPVRMILEEVAKLCEATDTDFVGALFHPRKHRPGRTPLQRIGELLRYQVGGYLQRIMP